MPFKDPERERLYREQQRVKIGIWRRKARRMLIEEAGGTCMDCGFSGRPWQFDFDHRDPSTKAFHLSSYPKGIDKLREEAAKCDLVCANCHRQRTHIQRCPGCEDCT